jgi:hypothetical protein
MVHLLSVLGGKRCQGFLSLSQSALFDMMLNVAALFSLRTAVIISVGSSLAACGGGGVSPLPAAGVSVSVEVLPKLQQIFRVDQAKNNQGLAYWDNYYYVGYDIGGGNGYIERYSNNGVIDPNYGRVPVQTRHTAELAFRAANERLYAVSGGGAEPTYVYQVSQDGKSVEKTYDFSAYGSAGLIAIDNINDLLVLTTTSSQGDGGPVSFRFIDWNSNNKVVRQFTIPTQGVPQGLEVSGGLIYFYTSNKITILDGQGVIVDSWDLKAAGESEGITLVNDGASTYLAVGFNGPQRVYAIRPIQLGVNAPIGKHFVLMGE